MAGVRAVRLRSRFDPHFRANEIWHLSTFAREQCVYLGESGNICGQLLDHLHGDNACIARCSPTHFAYELTASATRRARHQELVQEFQPVCTAG